MPIDSVLQWTCVDYNSFRKLLEFHPSKANILIKALIPCDKNFIEDN